MDDSYDLVVIGAGPAGEVAAGLAAAFGRTVLVVERSAPGGVVTTTGGAPTKALREAALYLTGYRQEEVYGVRAAAPLARGGGAAREQAAAPAPARAPARVLGHLAHTARRRPPVFVHDASLVD